MRTYDEFLQHGLDGTELWNAIKNRVASHHDILTEMRERQKALAVYAKSGTKFGQVIDGVDAAQHSLLKDIKFLETMAWRIYMFGSRSLFSPKPGRDGEYMKRQRTDPSYWKEKAINGQRKADKQLKARLRQEWEKTILRRYKY
jgi:hypothetical protein